MSAASHTPGPWCLRHSRDGSGDVGIGAPDINNVIAECFAAMRSREERAVDEALANARLIAAAPELLEALRALLPLAKGYETPHASLRALVPGWIALAEAAIAKAEGR